MKPSLALVSAQNRDAIHRVVKSRRGINPRVFGSVLDGTDEEGSDLDLLVDPAPGMTLLDLGGMQGELTELLGVAVDVSTPGGLPEKCRDAVIGAARAI